MQQVNEIFQIASVTLLALTCLLFARNLRQGMHLWTGIGFTLSIVAYLIIETEFAQRSFLHVIIMTGAICIPVLFWLLSKTIFDDHFKGTPVIAFWFLTQLILHVHHYFCDLFPNPIESLLNVISEIVSIGFVLASLYVALKTRQGDLIESRLRFRNIFIIITAVLIGLTLIVEATAFAQQSKIPLQILQRASILLLTAYFLLSNFDFRSGFFFRETPKPKPSASTDTVLEDKLMKLLTEQWIYRKEGLTIKELAELMEVQEHRLRRLINGQLGFKNFNDFLNQYRVNEACEILTDASQNQKTILEIAYALGYQSIGPFNKAFKEQKNTTPTAFRKAQSQ